MQRDPCITDRRLSIPTIFSSLVDAAGYFERLHISPGLSTRFSCLFSFLPLVGNVAFLILWNVFRKRR